MKYTKIGNHLFNTVTQMYIFGLKVLSQNNYNI